MCESSNSNFLSSAGLLAICQLANQRLAAPTSTGSSPVSSQRIKNSHPERQGVRSNVSLAYVEIKRLLKILQLRVRVAGLVENGLADRVID
jgi:hypothetical protein